MTVPEMGKLLGLKKTDRYWLVHKNVFESKEIAGKIRINIASFEKWCRLSDKTDTCAIFGGQSET